MRFRFFTPLLAGLSLFTSSHHAHAQRPAPIFDLPLPPWGFASRLSDAPTFLADRSRERVFVFPLIVGQKRTEVAFSPFSKGRTYRPERVALTRRSLGMSPANAEKDDAGGKDGVNPRRWRVREADTRHALTRFECEFPAVAPTQKIISGDNPPDPWTPGTAELTLYSGNAAPAAEGLLVEVKLTNLSAQPQTYFVDALAAMETDFANPTMLAPDPHLFVTAEDASLTARHSDAKIAFAVESDDRKFAPRAYRVTADYFAASADLEPLNETGGSSPNGLQNASLDGNGNANGKGVWGLFRVDNVRVPARGSVTVRFCIGAGHDAEGARTSTQTLLSVASDLLPDGGKRDTPGLRSLALAAHRDAMKSSGFPAFDALLARSVIITPFEEVGRLVTLSRGGIPTPEASAALVSGWACAVPEFAAAQAIDSLALLAKLSPERRGEALLDLLTALDAIPPDIRRLTSLKSVFLPVSEMGKSLTQPVLYPIAVLLERFAVETGAEKADEDFWRAAREKGATGYVAPVISPLQNGKAGDFSPTQFLSRWNLALEAKPETGNLALVLAEAKARLAGFETSAQTGIPALDNLALLPFARLFHTPGTVAHGRFVSLLGVIYEEKKDELRFGFRAFDPKRGGVILCRMVKPNTLYHLTGLEAKELKSDENGLLTLPVPPNADSTQTVEIKAGETR